MHSKHKCTDQSNAISKQIRSLTVFGKAGLYRYRESAHQGGLREDRRRARYKGCNKNQAFRPNVRLESLQAAADHNAQPDLVGSPRQPGCRPLRLRLRQSPRRERDRWQLRR